MSDTMSYDNDCLTRFSRFSDFPNLNVAISREMLYLSARYDIVIVVTLRCKITARVISSL